jgi:hypothetical protein
VTRRLAAAWVFAALFAARAGAGAPPASFDYLYIRAHEGNASGGHAAVRFGDDTFDFQHDGRWVRMRREDSRRFQHDYRVLQNRSIAVSRVAASPETVTRLRETFERRRIAQTRQLELLAELDGDLALLDALAAGDAAPVPVRGAGFFADAGDSHGPAPAVLSLLREAIARRHGSGFLAARCDATARALREEPPRALDPSAIALDPVAVPFADDALVRRFARALAALSACDLLARPRRLLSGVRAGERLAPDPWLALDADLRARVLAARAALLDAATGLAASRRPDWGEALLLAAARLAAIDESLAAGRLVMLDAFPADAKRFEVGSRRRALLPALMDDARRDFIAARERVVNRDGFRESAWNALERAVSRLAELRAVDAGRASLRVHRGPMLPEGVALVSLPRPAAPRAELERGAAAGRAARGAYERALEDRYRYHVVQRNCVSELFRTIEAALASMPGAPPASDRESIRAFVAEESRRRLGGYVAPLASANFVPFVSSQHVREHWRMAEQIQLPSVREHAAQRDGTWTAALRESNVVTATSYEPAEDDGFFVFFTDGAWPLRPLLGAANLAAALARSGVGVVQLPFDGGDGLREGLGGALWSLPELFFTNIRKGTNEYVPPAQRPPPG